MNYHLWNIRKLLTTVFTVSELRDFCQYTPAFKSVHDNLRSDDRKADILRISGFLTAATVNIR